MGSNASTTWYVTGLIHTYVGQTKKAVANGAAGAAVSWPYWVEAHTHDSNTPLDE